MQKEELEAILDRGEAIPDLGPIEKYIHALATEEQLPDFAFAICAARFEEAGPILREVLERAAGGESLAEDEKMLVFRGLHILGGARDTLAFETVIRLLHRPHKEVDDLLGDAITESLSKILAGLFDGNDGALFDLIADPSVDEFIRDQAFRTVAFLTFVERIEASATFHFLERFFSDRLAEDEDMAWIGWLDAIALLGLNDLVPLVDQAWQEGRINPSVLERRHFDRSLARTEKKPDDAQRFADEHTGYIEDSLEELAWTRRDPSFGSEDETRALADEAPHILVPAVNPWRHVGRNDPCPCGSGKKAKKCCLAH